MRNVLWVGDACCQSGFAKATHEIGDRLCQDFQFSVLGINAKGDRHPYDYDVYPAAPGGDMFGLGRMIEICDKVRPNVVVLQNDGWNIQPYMVQLKRAKEHAETPVIAVVAVDGKNFQGEWLKGVSHAIFWTNFALREARAGGYEGPASVIPLGVDLDKFQPRSKRESRYRIFKGYMPDETFVVGSVNRNQPRKRADLLIRYFAEWIHTKNVDAILFMHVAPTGDAGIDVEQLARFYGVHDRLARREPPLWSGIDEDEMCDTYNCFDVFATTTQGEGFGLTPFEAMACGVPGVVPSWSALEELCENACCMVPCTSTSVTFGGPNVIGGVPDEQAFIETLHALYLHKEYRVAFSKLGLGRVSEQRFSWNNIAERYAEVLEQFVHEPVAQERLHA